MTVLIIIVIALAVLLCLCFGEMYKQSKLIAYLEDELRDAERELQRLHKHSGHHSQGGGGSKS